MVVVGTEGLWENLWDAQLLELVSGTMRWGFAGRGVGEGEIRGGGWGGGCTRLVGESSWWSMHAD